MINEICHIYNDTFKKGTQNAKKSVFSYFATSPASKYRHADQGNKTNEEMHLKI